MRASFPGRNRGAADDFGRLKAVAELLELSPARVSGLLLVLVRLAVQIATADGTETGAVRAAEDLGREREGDRVTRPAGQIEPVFHEVWSLELLSLARIGCLVLLPVHG